MIILQGCLNQFSLNDAKYVEPKPTITHVSAQQVEPRTDPHPRARTSRLNRENENPALAYKARVILFDMAMQCSVPFISFATGLPY